MSFIRWDLKSLARRELGVEVDKDLQKSDWTGDLTPEQIDYAMLDADLALDLWLKLEAEFDGGTKSGFNVINDALPSVAECNLTGLFFDRVEHKKLCEQLEHEIKALKFELDLLSDCRIDNHGSAKQVSQWASEQILAPLDLEVAPTPEFAATVFQRITDSFWPLGARSDLSLDKKVVTRLLADVEAGWPDLAKYLTKRVQFQKATKMHQAFGPKLAEKIDTDGRVRGSIGPHAAKTSRTSCRQPNLQQMPAEAEFRRMFLAPAGRKLVIADYSQIELRVGAIIGRDQTMIRFFQEGADIHAETFLKTHKALTGEDIVYDPEVKWHKQGRKNTKAVNFGILYGAKGPTVALSTGLPVADAETLIAAWKKVFPGLAEYIDTQPEKAKRDGFIRLVSGQRIGLVKSSRPSQMINAPVQGSAASVMYRAMARVNRRLERDGLDASMCQVVHDEVLLETSEQDAIPAAYVLQEEMTAALLDLFPEAADLGLDGVADAAICDNWGQKDDSAYSLAAFIEANPHLAVAA